MPYTLNVELFQSPKKPKATYVMIHGIGNSLDAWDPVVARMPKDVMIIGIDLLGFGDSPKPHWATYNARTQARALALTLVNLRLKQRPILVGHSLGALVAVEVAKRYPLFIKQLILCSPPFYKPEVLARKGLKPQEDRLRAFYRLARRFPEQLEKMSPLAVKLGLANRAFSITQDTIGSYIAALEASIINQTSLEDVGVLKLPITIFYGTLDPVVIGKHIVQLGKTHGNITVKRVLAGHEVVLGYAKSVGQWITRSHPERYDAPRA
jgi:pimeloyl-ACP methyl ester carboxylesterase